MCGPDLNFTGEIMKEDIELTRMSNAFDEIVLTIQPMLAKCMATAGADCATVVVRQLAIEFAARHMFAVKITLGDADQKEVIESFTASTLERLNDLIREATQLGLMEVRK